MGTSLRLGGQAALDMRRADAQLHRVEPEDSDHERMLDILWSQLQSEADNLAA